VESKFGAINAAREAVCLLLGFLSNVQAVRSVTVGLFVFIFGGGDILAFFVINGAA
jgi:hypothetical protein